MYVRNFRAEPASAAFDRVRSAGKFFQAGGKKWVLKGLTYGPFAPNSRGEFLPDRPQRLRDFAHMRDLGANVLRLYHLPPP